MKNIAERPNEKIIDLKEVRSIIEKRESLPENKRIDPNDFRNSYIKLNVNGKEIDAFPLNMIKGDLEDVERMKKEIIDQKSQLSEFQINANTVANFVEMAVPEAIKNLGWLGEDVKVIRPSLYDDYFNGVDNIIQMSSNEILESGEKGKYIGLSIDFTISEDQSMGKVWDNALLIAQGKMSQVKYFSTDIKTKHGIENVKIRDLQLPKIIMSCPHKILSKSQEDLLNFEKDSSDNDTREKAKDTVLKYHFIKETISQLKFFAEIAKRFKNINAENSYNTSLNDFIELIREQGITDEILDEKVGDIQSLSSRIDLDASDSLYIRMLRDVVKSK
jgi:hypothetical protein